MLQNIYTTAILLITTITIKVRSEESQSAVTIHSNSNAHLQDHDLPSTLLEYDMTEEEKRAWKDLQTSGWGKRSWRDLHGGWGKRSWKDLSGSGWGKRGWQDLQTSGWGKRGWQNLQSSGWGKRGWQNLQASGWGKRSWKSLPSSGWGKRSWNEPQNFWDKTDRSDSLDNSENNIYSYDLEDSLDEAKRAWNNLKPTWGKRSDWASMKGAWGKRDPAWHNLKGLWGKRSLDNYSDITSQNLQDLNYFPLNYDSDE